MKISVSIRNYEAYKGRSDVKLNSWFRLSNRFLEDSDFFDFDFEEKMAWVYCLSIASQKNSGQILINLDHATKVCGFKKEKFLKSLEKLSNINCLIFNDTSTLRPRNAHDTSTCATEQTEHNKTEHNKTEQETAKDLNFEYAYNLYPLKKGKSKGLAKMSKEIKTQFDLDNFIKAIQNYKKDIAANKTQSKYIKHFSTFCSEWKDWLDYVPAASGNHSFQNTRIDMVDDFNNQLAKVKES